MPWVEIVLCRRSYGVGFEGTATRKRGSASDTVHYVNLTINLYAGISAAYNLVHKRLSGKLAYPLYLVVSGRFPGGLPLIGPSALCHFGEVCRRMSSMLWLLRSTSDLEA